MHTLSLSLSHTHKYREDDKGGQLQKEVSLLRTTLSTYMIANSESRRARDSRYTHTHAHEDKPQSDGATRKQVKDGRSTTTHKKKQGMVLGRRVQGGEGGRKRDGEEKVAAALDVRRRVLGGCGSLREERSRMQGSEEEKEEVQVVGGLQEMMS